jgi:hypothetical protein
MFEGECELTYEEESQIEHPANIYSLIKTLEFIEWAYNFSHIDQKTYVDQTNTILDQYKSAIEAYDKYPGIDEFTSKYGLQDCKFAIRRIKLGDVQKPTSGTELQIIASIIQVFNDISNTLIIAQSNQNTMIVSDINGLFNELASLLQKVRNIINLEHPDIKKLLDFNLKLRSRKAADKIEDDEQKQIESDVKIAFQTFNKMLSERNK